MVREARKGKKELWLDLSCLEMDGIGEEGKTNEVTHGQEDKNTQGRRGGGRTGRLGSCYGMCDGMITTYVHVRSVYALYFLDFFCFEHCLLGTTDCGREIRTTDRSMCHVPCCCCCCCCCSTQVASRKSQVASRDNLNDVDGLSN